MILSDVPPSCRHKPEASPEVIGVTVLVAAALSKLPPTGPLEGCTVSHGPTALCDATRRLGPGGVLCIMAIALSCLSFLLHWVGGVKGCCPWTRPDPCTEAPSLASVLPFGNIGAGAATAVQQMAQAASAMQMTAMQQATMQQAAMQQAAMQQAAMQAAMHHCGPAHVGLHGMAVPGYGGQPLGYGQPQAGMPVHMQPGPMGGPSMYPHGAMGPGQGPQQMHQRGMMAPQATGQSPASGPRAPTEGPHVSSTWGSSKVQAISGDASTGEDEETKAMVMASCAEVMAAQTSSDLLVALRVRGDGSSGCAFAWGQCQCVCALLCVIGVRMGGGGWMVQ